MGFEGLLVVIHHYAKKMLERYLLHVLCRQFEGLEYEFMSSLLVITAFDRNKITDMNRKVCAMAFVEGARRGG